MSSQEKLIIKVPPVGESISEVTVSNWLKKDGDLVKVDDIICELDSDKTSFEISSESEGKLVIIAKEGEKILIGDVICEIHNFPQENPKENVSPLAKSILQEFGIESKGITGTGFGGKVIKEDVLNLVNKNKPQPNEYDHKDHIESKNEIDEIERVQRRVKMSSLRKTVSRRLVSVKNETAMLTTFNEVDMKSIMDLRTKYKDKFKEKHNIGLGFMSFFTKACTIALTEFPQINAFIDGEDIVYNDFVDISIAVSSPKGLVVPVIRDVVGMSLTKIEKQINDLASLAKMNKLTPDQMKGGTFTITNGGVFGSMLSTPIINPPQSAILGMHNIVERPVVVDGQIVIRPIMYVALTYDHRIIDGKESVGFLVRVKELLEDPSRILIDV